MGDDAAGRQVQCPGCQHIGTTPVGVPWAGAEQNPLQPADQAFSQPEQNPFRSPTQTGGPSPDHERASQYAARRVAGPAIGLIIAGSISLAMYVCVTAIYSLVLILTLSGRDFGNQPSLPNLALGAGILTYYLDLVAATFSFLKN
jgi:hypothetical protein